MSNATLYEGDILVSSWGHGQTNIDFYEVTGKTEKMVILRQVAEDRKETRFMEGVTTPRRGVYIGRPIRRKPHGDAVNLTSYSAAWLWDGKPRRWSSYN